MCSGPAFSKPASPVSIALRDGGVHSVGCATAASACSPVVAKKRRLPCRRKSSWQPPSDVPARALMRTRAGLIDFRPKIDHGDKGYTW